MNTVETKQKPAEAQAGLEGGRRPRRRIAKDVLARGQRLRKRMGVLLGMSLGAAALLAILE